MTMQNTPHPDDERLAAYAGGDSDALADSSLVAHLSACDRCRPIVDELSLLRGALAELPDVAPSRPLRLIPPVPEPATRAAGPRVWLRRLTAPAMAAGAGLVLIGAVGFGASAAVDLLPKAASGGAAAEAAASDRDVAPVPGAAATSDRAGGHDRQRRLRELLGAPIAELDSAAFAATVGAAQRERRRPNRAGDG